MRRVFRVFLAKVLLGDDQGSRARPEREKKQATGWASKLSPQRMAPAVALVFQLYALAHTHARAAQVLCSLGSLAVRRSSAVS